MNDAPSDMIVFIMSVLGIFIGVVLVIGLISYIFGSLGLYTIARNRGYDKPFLAWIPIASSYLLGAVGDDINAKLGKKTYYGVILVGYSILSMVLSGVSSSFTNAMIYSSYGYGPSTAAVSPFSITMWLIMAVGGIAITVLQFVVYYKIYKTYTPSNATLLIVLSVLFMFIIPFVLFAIRKNHPVDAFNAGGSGGYGGYNQQSGYNQGAAFGSDYRNAQDTAIKNRDDSGDNTGSGI